MKASCLRAQIQENQVMAESSGGPQHRPESGQVKGKASGSKDSPVPAWVKGNPTVGENQYTPTYQIAKRATKSVRTGGKN
jgi:hypothetical protein